MLTLTLPYTKTLEIESSLIAYIAKRLAHPGDGEKDKGYRARDIAFEPFHSSHLTFLLIKVCMFVLGSLILLKSLRPSSCSYRESPSMRSHAWTILLLLSTTTQCGSGACTTRYYVLNSTADAFKRLALPHHVYIFLIMMFEQRTQPLLLRSVINHPWPGASTHLTEDGNVEESAGL